MFSIDYAALFNNFPPEVATLLIAMLPIAELRAAIPLAITTFDLSWWSAYLWAVIGNIIPAIFLLLFLDPVARFLRKHSRAFDRFFEWVFTRTRKRFISKSQKYGRFIALVLFVAIPLPITGAWTGSAAAFLFGIPFSRSWPAVCLGVCISGVIVTITTVGIASLF